MSTTAKLTASLAVTLAAVQVILSANALPVPKGARVPRTPEEMAVEAYNHGIDSRNRALKAEEQAQRAATAPDRAASDQKAHDEYQQAFAQFEEAASLNPALPQAWNALGFVHRKLGDYERSLSAYDRALSLAPNFPDALEYRGETYLALNRIADAKQAYLDVFALDRKQADILLRAMASWVAQRTSHPAGLDPAAILELDTWVRERAAIAEGTRLMGRDAEYKPW